MFSYLRAGLVLSLLSLLVLTTAAPVYRSETVFSPSLYRTGAPKALSHLSYLDLTYHGRTKPSQKAHPGQTLGTTSGVAAGEVRLQSRGFFDSIANGFKNLGGAIKNVAQNVGNGVKKAVQTVGNVAKKVVNKATTAVKTVVKKAASTVKTVAKKVVNGAKQVAKTVANGAKKVAKKVGKWVKKEGPIIGKVGLKSISTAQEAASKVVQFVPVVGKPLSKVMDIEGKVLSKASDAIPVKLTGKVADAVNGMDKAQKVMEFIPRDLEGEISERDLYEIDMLAVRDDAFDDYYYY